MLNESVDKEHPSFVSDFNGHMLSSITPAGLWLQIYPIKEIFVCSCFSKVFIINEANIFQMPSISVEIVKIRVIKVVKGSSLS